MKLRPNQQTGDVTGGLTGDLTGAANALGLPAQQQDAQDLLGNAAIQVTIEGAKTRASPRLGASVVEFLDVDDTLTLDGEPVQGDLVEYYESSTWLPVIGPSGDDGFILDELTNYAGEAALTPEVEGELPAPVVVEEAPEAASGEDAELTGTTSAFARVRSGPDVETDEVVLLTEVTTVRVLDASVPGGAATNLDGTTWMHIELPDGRQGYMHAGLITLVDSGPSAGSDQGGGASGGGTSSGITGAGGLVTGGAVLRTEASYDPNDSSRYFQANLPGGTSFEVLESVEGTLVGTNSTWSHVRIDYSSDANLIGEEGYIFTGVYRPITGPVDMGHTREQLVALLGASVVDSADWSEGNPFAPTYGGPDFFAAGRYGGQCTWFAEALYDGRLPTENAGYGAWTTDARKTGTPAVGKVYVTPGHVAYITAVSGSAGSWTITLAESNYGSSAEISAGRQVNITTDPATQMPSVGWFL